MVLSESGETPAISLKEIMEEQKQERRTRIRKEQKNLQPEVPKTFTIQNLNSKSKEYKNIYERLHDNKGFRDKFQVFRIKKVTNEALLGLYKAKRKSKTYKENLCFHGTPIRNLKSILTNNFNVSKCEIRRGKFGWGVSFAKCPYYATHYSKNNCDESTRVMIIVKVLIGKSHEGNHKSMMPEEGYDTTTSPDGQVIVKYEENTFYPQYVVYFGERDEINKE